MKNILIATCVLLFGIVIYLLFFKTVDKVTVQPYSAQDSTLIKATVDSPARLTTIPAANKPDTVKTGVARLSVAALAKQGIGLRKIDRSQLHVVKLPVPVATATVSAAASLSAAAVRQPAVVSVSGVSIDSAGLSKAISVGKSVIAPGFVAKKSYTTFRQLNKLDVVGIQGELGANGLHPELIERYSKSTFDALKNTTFKRACVVLGVGSAVLVVEEYMFPSLSYPKRLLIAGSIGVLFLLLFIWGQNAKVFK